MALAFPIRGACRNCGGTTCSKTCFKVKEISEKPLSNQGFFILVIFITMANVIASGTTVSNGTLKRNNFLIGVNTSVQYGPTSSTGFWNGVVPPTSGYTVYEQKSVNGPSIRTASNDTELITIAKQCGGTNITTIYDALNYFNGQTNYMVTNIDYPNIVTSGLSAILDAGYVPSYPKTGSTVYDLSGNGANGTLNGNVAWVSSGTTGSQSYFNFPNASTNTGIISSSISQSYFDCSVVLMPDFTLNNNAGLAAIIGISTPAGNADKSLRMTGASGSGPWTMIGNNPDNNDGWASPSATTYYVNGTSGNTLNAGWNVFGGYRTNTVGFPSTFPYYIGSSSYSAQNRCFQGNIAVVLLYNRRLSAQEQLQNYNALKTRFGL